MKKIRRLAILADQERFAGIEPDEDGLEVVRHKQAKLERERKRRRLIKCQRKFYRNLGRSQ